MIVGFTNDVMKLLPHIKQKLNEARSENGSGIIECATRVEALGFVSSANVRYSEFLKLFQNSTRHTEYYQEKYPSSLFLNWKAFHALLKAMDLWVDLPVNYLGAVPSEQLPWMEIFELKESDLIKPIDVFELLPSVRSDIKDLVLSAVSVCDSSIRKTENYYGAFDRGYNAFVAEKIMPYWKQALESFFVIAPKEAFSTVVDWIGGFTRLLNDRETIAKIPPNYPLVVRFCHGGALVVAAWGDEAAFLNQAAQDAKV